MKDFIITVDHIDPKKRKAIICKVLTHMKKLGYTTVDRYVKDMDNPEGIGYITTKGVHDKGWGMCMEWYGLCGKGTCDDCSCGWDKVAVEDFLKFTTSDVEVVKAEPKKIYCKIDLSWLRNEAREVISEAVQKKLFEAGCKWSSGDAKPILCDKEYLFVEGCSVSYNTEKYYFDDRDLPEVSVNNALKGNFWTYSTKKEEPKPEGYKVSLAAYTGKAREAISKAIQEEAFKKGFGWGCVFHSKDIKLEGEPFVYFNVGQKCLLSDETADAEYFAKHEYKELSVENILSGILPSVK